MKYLFLILLVCSPPKPQTSLPWDVFGGHDLLIKHLEYMNTTDSILVVDTIQGHRIRYFVR